MRSTERARRGGRKRSFRSSRDHIHRRRLILAQSGQFPFEVLEARRLLAGDWQNRDNTFDANRDGRVTALDALVSINESGRKSVIAEDGTLPDRDGFEDRPFWDVSGDNRVTSLDPLSVINALGRDFVGPLVFADLFSDTGTGVGQSDRVTSEPTVIGVVTDTLGVQSLSALVDDGAGVPVLFDSDGAFSFIPDLLLDGSDDGAHDVVFVATDPKGNESTSEPFAFSLDTRGPETINFDLAPESDTAPLGDRITTIASVRLTGQVESLANIALLSQSNQAAADATGAFSLSDVVLQDGNNDLLFRVTDIAGEREPRMTRRWRASKCFCWDSMTMSK